MKISVITAVFNNREFVSECIESVLVQTYRDIEYIVVDGGSTDGTVDVIKRHAGKIAKWVSEPDGGIYDAMNKGLGMATGEAVGFLQSDDLYADDDVMQKVADAMSDRKTACVYGDLVYVKKDAPHKVVRYWKAGRYTRDMLKQGWMPPHPTFFVRREMYERYGVFDAAFSIAADYEAILRFLWKHELSTIYIPEVLVKMRVGGASNRSIGNIIKKSTEDYRAMKLNGVGGLGTLMAKNIRKLPQFLPFEYRKS